MSVVKCLMEHKPKLTGGWGITHTSGSFSSEEREEDL